MAVPERAIERRIQRQAERQTAERRIARPLLRSEIAGRPLGKCEGNVRSAVPSSNRVTSPSPSWCGGCRRRESNSDGLSPKHLPSARVCQFRHAGHPERRRNPDRAVARMTRHLAGVPNRGWTVRAGGRSGVTGFLRAVPKACVVRFGSRTRATDRQCRVRRERVGATGPGLVALGRGVLRDQRLEPGVVAQGGVQRVRVTPSA
jgi:hypothetical protein